MTVAELIRSSLRLIGQLAPGRGPNASETADALLALNSMIDAWATERLIAYEIGRDEYSWPASTPSRTIGPGGNMDAHRPVAIESAGYVDGGAEIPLEAVDARKWAMVCVKSTPGGPQYLYNDRAYPRSRLYLWPVPSAAVTLVLYPWRALAAFATTTQDVDLPPGYADAIRYNLAVHLGEEWGKSVNGRVQQMAAEKKARIKALNMPTIEMGVDEALLGGGTFDIMTGGNYGR